MYSESDLLPLSGIQHAAFCERQWALIHIEQQWTENRLTAEGRQIHERVHDASDELREGVRICRGLRLRSMRLGLIGQADVVEFHPAPGGGTVPYPIEYKRGRPKPDRCDAVQLCAQAMCLEEMLCVSVPCGAIFYGQPRRRAEFSFDLALRLETETLAVRLHELMARSQTPPAQYDSKCDRCSLFDLCNPRGCGTRSASEYLRRSLADILANPEDA